MPPIPSVPRRRLHAALLHLLSPTDASLETVIALLAEVRHWCHRHDESYDALDHIARELHLADLASDRRRQL